MADGGGGFFANFYGPFTKKGDTMMFYDGNDALE